MARESVAYSSMEELLDNYSHIRLATPEDNEEILKFYDNESMDAGGESISFDRNPNYFSFYDLSAKKYWALIFLNKDQTIGGVGGILRHVRKVDGRDVPLAYFCDLRISAGASRITKLQWRKFFPDVVKTLRNLPEEERCESAYTAILASNSAAVNSLTKEGRGVTYRRLGNYFVHSYVGTGLVRSKKYSASEITQDEFISFYSKENEKRFLAEDPRYTIDNLETQANKTPYLGIKLGEETVAVVKPVLNNETRRIKAQNLNRYKRMLCQSFKLLSRPVPNENGELYILDLPFLTYKEGLSSEEKNKVLEAIQSWIKEKNLLKDIHLINVVDSDQKIDSHILKRGINIVTEGLLFEVHPEGEEGLLPTSNFRFEGAFL